MTVGVTPPFTGSWKFWVLPLLGMPKASGKLPPPERDPSAQTASKGRLSANLSPNLFDAMGLGNTCINDTGPSCLETRTRTLSASSTSQT